MNKLLRFLVVATAASAFLFAFSQGGSERHFAGRFLTYPLLKPGEKIDDMVITTGAENAYPLSAFCSPTKLSDGSIRVDCAELAVCANLAIGETFGVLDLIPSSIDWGELTWELSVDGHPIDLKAFGLSDIVRPD